MNKILLGTAYVLADDIGVDQILPNHCTGGEEALSKYALEGADAGFASRFQKGGAIVAGSNFGHGPSSEQAAGALAKIGISMILAESVDKTFYRDAINIALPVLVCPGIRAHVNEGDKIEADLETCMVKNKTTGKSIPCTKVSEYALSILEGGGIKAVLAQQARNSGLPETEYTGWDTAKDFLLATARERDRVYYYYLRDRLGENPSWAAQQQQLFKFIDDFLAMEAGKGYKLSVGTHEAGGQFRVAFPHMFVRDAQKIIRYMNDFMAHQRNHVKEKRYHGYVDCAEVHHEPETFLYYQIPMLYWDYESKPIAAESILDMAEHIGNFSDEVLPWYDWGKHEFVSTWVGTREVRDYPIFDYQEGNHFRLINIAVAAYKASGDDNYLRLINDYCGRWCDHIEQHADREYIPCSILPSGAQVEEMNCAGNADEHSAKYQTFYTTVAVNTAHDVVVGLFNAYRLTSNERYLNCAKTMIDQFIKNGSDGRPAFQYSNGAWSLTDNNPTPAGEIVNGRFRFANTMLGGLLMMYDRITGTETYKGTILAWADTINEDENYQDLASYSILSYAHYYSGKQDLLVRAHDMYLRTAALAAHSDVFHQCDARMTQGNKASAECLYLPVFGCVNFGVRGSLPLPLVKHITGGRTMLPQGVSFRLWKCGEGHQYEAINHNQEAVRWTLEKDDHTATVEIAPLGIVTGSI